MANSLMTYNGHQMIAFPRRSLIEVRGTWGNSVLLNPKHILDENHPRVCFNCEKELKFIELKLINSDYEYKHLEKLWKSDNIRFYCCECYDYIINKSI